MSCHALDVDDAIKHGVDAAILLYNLRRWLVVNRANNRNAHNGYYWSYNKASAYAEIFPYWTANKIQKTLKKLENEGVIITGSYSENKYDRTKWYSMPEFKVRSHSANPLNDSSQCADSSISNINTNIIYTDNSFSKRLVSVKDLGKDFQQCKDAYEHLGDHDWLYLGKLSIEEWSDCEDAMNSVDFEFGYFDWWADRYRNTFTKKPSLRNILSGTSKMSFDEFYDNTYAK